MLVPGSISGLGRCVHAVQHRNKDYDITGAAATEKLDLFPIGATQYYEGYPEGMEDPLKYFIALINQVGLSSWICCINDVIAQRAPT